MCLAVEKAGKGDTLPASPGQGQALPFSGYAQQAGQLGPAYPQQMNPSGLPNGAIQVLQQAAFLPGPSLAAPQVQPQMVNPFRDAPNPLAGQQPFPAAAAQQLAPSQLAPPQLAPQSGLALQRSIEAASGMALQRSMEAGTGMPGMALQRSIEAVPGMSLQRSIEAASGTLGVGAPGAGGLVLPSAAVPQQQQQLQPQGGLLPQGGMQPAGYGMLYQQGSAGGGGGGHLPPQQAPQQQVPQQLPQHGAQVVHSGQVVQQAPMGFSGDLRLPAAALGMQPSAGVGPAALQPPSPQVGAGGYSAQAQWPPAGSLNPAQGIPQGLTQASMAMQMPVAGYPQGSYPGVVPAQLSPTYASSGFQHSPFSGAQQQPMPMQQSMQMQQPIQQQQLQVSSAQFVGSGAMLSPGGGYPQPTPQEAQYPAAGFPQANPWMAPPSLGPHGEAQPPVQLPHTPANHPSNLGLQPQTVGLMQQDQAQAQVCVPKLSFIL